MGSFGWHHCCRGFTSLLNSDSFPPSPVLWEDALRYNCVLQPQAVCLTNYLFTWLYDLTAPSSDRKGYCNKTDSGVIELGCVIWFCAIFFFSLLRHADLGLHGAVRSPQRANPGAGSLLRVLAQRGRGYDPDTDSRHHGWVDHEHLLGNGHGHPGQSVLVCSRLRMFLWCLFSGGELFSLEGHIGF